MSFKQKQKLTVCIVFLLVVLVFILIGSPSDVVAKIMQLWSEMREDLKHIIETLLHFNFYFSKEEIYVFIAWVVFIIDTLIDLRDSSVDSFK